MTCAARCQPTVMSTLPPPLSLTARRPLPDKDLVKVLNYQAQLLESMAQDLRNLANSSPHCLQQESEDSFKMELSTFDGTTQDPMVAIDWLYEIKEKLDLADYSNEECVKLVAQQLKGPALAWWSHFTCSHPDPPNIT